LLYLCKKTFCKNREDEDSFIRFMFMNYHSIEEYTMMFIIDRERCADLPKIIQNAMTAIFTVPISKIIQNFLVHFKAE
jgi:hypothetical protein